MIAFAGRICGGTFGAGSGGRRRHLRRRLSGTGLASRSFLLSSAVSDLYLGPFFQLIHAVGHHDIARRQAAFDHGLIGFGCAQGDGSDVDGSRLGILVLAVVECDDVDEIRVRPSLNRRRGDKDHIR